jgi:NAD(P)-dependent dehydrogenase (short-subunit alcohol dehydrogenase family)
LGPLQQTQKVILEDKAEEAATSKCLCVVTDVSIDQDVSNLSQTVQRNYGLVDLSFNNAGINAAASSLEEVNLDDFERVMKTNVTGPFLVPAVIALLITVVFWHTRLDPIRLVTPFRNTPFSV